MSLIDIDSENRVNKNLGRMHRGIVVDDADPQERGRVKLVIEGLIESTCPPDILPWAYPGISTQYRADLGGFTPPPIGTVLYVQFAHNNVYAPIYFGAAGDTTVSGAGPYGSNVRPYEGATYDGYGGPATPFSGSKAQKAATLKDGLIKRGLTPTAAEGVVLNLDDESGLNPGAVEGTPNVHGTRGYGLAQWTGSRRTDLFNYAAQQGKPANDYNVQLDFLMKELKSPDYAKAYSGIQGAGSQGEAATAFLRDFERPAAQHVASRSAKYLRNPKTFIGGPSEELEKYDANQANSRQGPTIPKDEHLKEGTYGVNQIPIRQDGSKPETSVGTSFGTVDDGSTKAGLANYVTFDRKNNTFDLALATLGINIHVDNQGRLWINVDKDINITMGGNVYKYVKGTETKQTDGETYSRKNGAVTEYYDKNIAKTVKGNRIVNVSGSDMVVADVSETQANAFRSSSAGGSAVALMGISTFAEGEDDLPDINSKKGEEYRKEKQKEYDDDKQVEHNKRQVYIEEVTRGHSLVAEAAGSSAITQANVMLGRIKDLALSGLNTRIPGGIMSMLPGQGGMAGMDGILGMLGGDIMSKIAGFLPKEITQNLGAITNIAGGGSIQNILQPIIGNAVGQAIGQIQQFLPDPLKNLPLALLKPGEISQVLASLTNKDALSAIMTSAIKQQLSSLIPQELLNDQTVKKIVSTVMDVNKLGVLPDGQSPASSLELIPAVKIATDVLSYVNNFTGLDDGYFYQIASGTSTSSGMMKFPYERDGVRAVLAKVVKLTTTTSATSKSTSVEDVLTETYPMLTRAQITEQAKSIDVINKRIIDNPPTPTPMIKILPETPTNSEALVAYANPIKLLTPNPPKDSEVQTAADQLVKHGTETQPPRAETGEDGQVPDPYKDMAIQAAYVAPDNPAGKSSTSAGTTEPDDNRDDTNPTLDNSDPSKLAPTGNVNAELVSSCVARPEGQVGKPADAAAYQNGATGEGAPVGDYSVPAAGTMTDADWGNMKYVTKANFENPGMMDRATVSAMDNASACYGSRIPWSEDGASGGHVKNSQHHTGNAFDIILAGMSESQKQSVLDCTFKAGFSGFGFYTKSPNMLHVDTRDSGNTWYWGNKNGNVPDWARPVWEKNGGTAGVVGRKPFGGKPRGYVGTGADGVAGENETDLTPKEGTGPTTGIGSQPLNPPHKQGDQPRSADRSYTIEVVARTCFGEAADQGKLGITAVAAVIRNRAMSGKFPGGRNLAGICLADKQFECWKRASRLNSITIANANFRMCVEAAAQAVDGTIADPTGGATFFQSGQKAKKSWTDEHTPTTVIKGHRFYV